MKAPRTRCTPIAWVMAPNPKTSSNIIEICGCGIRNLLSTEGHGSSARSCLPTVKARPTKLSVRSTVRARLPASTPPEASPAAIERTIHPMVSSATAVER